MSLKAVNSLAARVDLLLTAAMEEGEESSERAEGRIERQDASTLASATLSAHKRLREAMAARFTAEATMSKRLLEAPLAAAADASSESASP